MANLVKKAEELQKLNASSAPKRGAEDQSPGKEEGEGEPKGSSGKKGGKNAKKKSKEEQDLVENLFK